jgi:cysteine desulfurase
MTAYLDCNATTPVEPEVASAVLEFMVNEYGNAGSRTHEYGTRAKQAVQNARDQIARVVSARREEVIFTSGATESNNLAILGLATQGTQTNRRHIVSTRIEHKAVLEPLDRLAMQGFEITLLDVSRQGWVSSECVFDAVRDDTLLVSVMHVNNETGVVQPIAEIAECLADTDIYFHVDAAQGFGKDIAALQHPRIDLISASAHKIYGPKGIGALIARRRGFRRPPLTPLIFGGGQEQQLRPGTLPVPLIVGFGVAADLALRHHTARRGACETIRAQAIGILSHLDIQLNGDPEHTLPHTLNFSLPGVDAEAAMVALKGVASISNGSACTSASYTPSHVLTAMGLSAVEIATALRISWCHMSSDIDWDLIRERLAALR